MEYLLVGNTINNCVNQISCPVCGKYSSLKRFEPESSELNIITADMVGLGRGKGFKATNKQSVDFSSPIVSKINKRMLDLILIMISEGIISQKEIVEKLQLDEYVSIDDYKLLSDRLKKSDNKLKSYEFKFGRIVRLIAEALKEDFQNWYFREDYFEEDEGDKEWGVEEAKPITFLDFGLHRLIENYRALRASRGS